jgi:hypothetical protein
MLCKQIFTCIISLFITAACLAQKADFRKGNIVQQNFCDTIPFELVRNKIIITVKVNGVNRRFIFDTGAVLTISEEVQAAMKYAGLGSVEVNDVNGKTTDTKIVDVSELQIGRVTFQHFASVVFDLKKNYPINCLNCDGIVGSNVFKNCIVSIIMAKKILVLTDDVQKISLANAYQTPLTLNKIGKPYLKINIDDDISIEGLFDSGSDKLMSITDKVYDKAIKKGTATLLNEGFGVTSIGINGIAAAEKKNRALIKQVKFGNAAINNVITIESEKSGNAFGIQLAEYGTITLDYINKVFYFVALKQMQEYKNQKTLGIKDIPEKTFYAIGIVWSNTQAEKIGLKTGFQILKVNNQDFSVKSPENDCLFALADFFKSDKLSLTYKDNTGAVKTAELIEQ